MVTVGRQSVARRGRSLRVCLWGIYFVLIKRNFSLSLLPGAMSWNTLFHHILPTQCSASPWAQRDRISHPRTKSSEPVSSQINFSPLTGLVRCFGHSSEKLKHSMLRILRNKEIGISAQLEKNRVKKYPNLLNLLIKKLLNK